MGRTKTVAIIGAGMAGLAAANLLSARGVAVRLFEANAKVGGCCATTRIGGYTFNDGAIYLAMPGMLDHLFGMLGLDRGHLLPLKRISPCQFAALPDGTTVTIGEGPALAISVKQDAAATVKLQSELEGFLKKWEPTLRLFADDIMIHPLSLPHLLAKGWRHLSMLRGTAASHLNSSFSSEAVRAALAGALLYAGAPPDEMPAALLLGLVAMLRDGYFLPQGGMGRMPEVLSDALKARGGDIHLNSSIRRILVSGGRAHAVEVEHEGVVEVDAVISTTSAMHTYGTLLSRGDLPARMARRVQKAPLSHKGFVLQLGLSNKIETRSHTNCVLPWLSDQYQVFQPSADSLRWPIYTVPTVTLPELAPPGCSLIEMFPSIDQNIPPDGWDAARKEEVVAHAVERLRRDHDVRVAVCRVLSPKEFQDGAHLYAGALYGLSPVAGPRALFMHRSPIRGLYQAGQTTWPGFGVVGAGISGLLAAETLMRHESL
jgi:phytoene desaturase